MLNGFSESEKSQNNEGGEMIKYIEYTVKVFGNGSRWYLNDKLHREDGPACEWDDGSKSWFLNGQRVTEEEHRRLTSAKELTVQEISDLLGYEVKVVK